MAWTAPTGTDFSVGEIVTASKLNTYLANNLRYLKGLDGPISLDDRLNVPLASGTNGKGLRFGDATNQYGNLQGFDTGSLTNLFFASNRQFDGTGYQQLNARAGGMLMVAQDVLRYYTFAAASSTPVERMRIANDGKVGIGTSAPSGPLHVVGPSASWVQFDATLTNGTAQTVVPTGTANFMIFYAYLVRDTTANANSASAGIASTTLSTKSLYSSGADTVDLVYASGGFSLQRTGGTHSYQVALWIITL